MWCSSSNIYYRVIQRGFKIWGKGLLQKSKIGKWCYFRFLGWRIWITYLKIQIWIFLNLRQPLSFYRSETTHLCLYILLIFKVPINKVVTLPGQHGKQAFLKFLVSREKLESVRKQGTQVKTAILRSISAIWSEKCTNNKNIQLIYLSQYFDSISQ